MAFQQDCKAMEVSAPKLLTNDSSGLLRMVVDGLGVGQIYRSVAMAHFDSGELAPILEDWTNFSTPISIVYPPTRALNLRTRTSIDWLARRLHG